MAGNTTLFLAPLLSTLCADFHRPSFRGAVAALLPVLLAAGPFLDLQCSGTSVLTVRCPCRWKSRRGASHCRSATKKGELLVSPSLCPSHARSMTTPHMWRCSQTRVCSSVQSQGHSRQGRQPDCREVLPLIESPQYIPGNIARGVGLGRMASGISCQLLTAFRAQRRSMQLLLLLAEVQMARPRHLCHERSAAHHFQRKGCRPGQSRHMR
jgi:hypothetical protein